MRTPVIALLAVALLAAGCSEDTRETTDDPVAESTAADTAEPDTPTGNEGTAGTTDTGDAGDVEIDIRMFDFEDDVVEISAGETVTWTNHDATRHTVTSGLDGEPDGAFEVTFDDRDDTASVTFDEPGEYPYFCTPHDFMTGTVIVTG